MSLFDWIVKPQSFRIFEDSFARTRISKMLGLKNAIKSRADSDQIIILVAHFADTFTQLQEMLETNLINYEIVVSKIDLNWLEQVRKSGEFQVYVTLAEIMAAENLGQQQTEYSSRFGVLVAEKHPLPAKDERIELFCRALPYPVELGYFLSFDDAVVRKVINEMSIRILDMFGMGENELVTSNMISRRLKQGLEKTSKSIRTDYPGDSAEDWFERNLPPVTD